MVGTTVHRVRMCASALILVWLLAVSTVLVPQANASGSQLPMAAPPGPDVAALRRDPSDLLDPSGPMQGPHSVDAILAFIRSTANGTEVRYSFYGHSPATPNRGDALVWAWFSGNPAAPDLASPSAVIAAAAQTKQVRVAWSREGYALMVWDRETTYGNRTCPGPFDVSLYKSDIMMSVFDDRTGAWTAPAVAAMAPEDPLTHTRYDSASVAVDPGGNGLLVFANGTMDACTGAGARQIRYSIWNGATRTFRPHALLAATALAPVGLLPTTIAFAANVLPPGRTTRHPALVSWYDVVEIATKMCVPPAPDPPFNVTASLYWPQYARWDGNAFAGGGSAIPGRRDPPGRYESLAIRFGLSASPDMLGRATLAFTVITTTDICPTGPPQVAEVWQGRWNATADTWDNATKVADGKSPSVAHRPDLPRDRGDLVYEGPDPAAFDDPPVNRSALTGNTTSGDAQLDTAKGYNPALAHLAHNRTVAVWSNATNTLFYWARDDGTGPAGVVASLGGDGALGFLAARTGSPHLPHAEWTYLYYMSHDTYAAGPTTTLINRHEAVGSTALVNLVVLVDRKADPTHTREYYVRRGAGNRTELRDLGAVNMASSAALRNFIAENAELYPGRDLILVLRNHGHGWHGVCTDTNPNAGDWLNMTELRSALQTANYIFRMIVFSACQMGAIEVAHQVAGFGRYMIASQENHPTPNDGRGIREDQYLGRIIADPVGHADSFLPFATAIVTDFQANNQFNLNDYTLSLIDLVSVQGLVNDLLAFRNTIVPLIDPANPAFDATVRQGLSLHRNNTQAFRGDGAWRDVFHFMSRVQGDGTLPAGVRNAAQAVLNNEAGVVRAEWSDTAKPNARGLNVWFTVARATYNAERNEFSQTRFDTDTAWRDVVRFLSHTRGVQLALETNHPWLFLWIRDLGNRTVGTYSDLEDCGGFCESEIPEASCNRIGPGMRIFLPGWTEAFEWFVDGTLLPASSKRPAPRSTTAAFNLTIQEIIINDAGDTVVLYEERYGGFISTNETQSGRFFPDVAGPVTSASLTGSLGLNGWYTSSVNVTLSASDPRSGVASTSYRVDGGAWQTYTGTFSIAADGVYSVEYRSTDFLGNVEPTRSDTVSIDTVAPTSSRSLTGTLGAGGWYVTSVTVDLAASDLTSGVDRVEYRVDGGAWQTYTAPFVVGSDGMHTIDYFATDSAGLSELPNSFSLDVDTTSPTTTASLAGTPGSGGWYVSPVTVTLNAADGGSGVASISYRVDGGSFQSYAAAFPVSTDGNHTVDFFATNVAGLAESTRTTNVRIDRTAPSTVHSLAGTLGANGWYRTSVTVTLNPADATSGVSGTTYSVDGGASVPYTGPFLVTGDGSHLVVYGATDVAGNAESPRSANISIDATAPSSLASIAGTSGTNGWYLSSATVTLTSADATSGVVQVQYRIDGGAWTPYVGPFVLFDGNHTLEHFATDMAGGVEPVISVPIRVDTVVPSSIAGVTGTVGLAGWYVSTATATLSSVDATSGVSRIEYRIDGGAWTTYTAPLGLTDGNHLVEYRATDVAGNVETFRSVQARVDATPPTTATSPSGTPGSNGWYVSSVSVGATPADATSGPAGTEYRVDGGPWQTYVTPAPVPEGVHTLEFRSTDVAGNVESPVTTNVRVDTIVPSCSLGVSGTAGTGGWYTTAVIATLECADATSGIASRQFRLDPGSWTAYSAAVSITADGTYNFEYSATDDAGLTATASQVIRIDATIPEVTIPSPADGTTVQGTTVEVTWSSVDAGSGSASCSVAVDGGTPANVGTATSRRLEDLTVGAHTVAVTCRDVAGNQAQRTVTFSNAAGIPASGLSLPLVAGILFLVVAIALIAFLLMRRGGKKEADGASVAEESKDEAAADDEDEFEL